eukprot:1152790-Pelagomonas_calceolata.AAC.3
MEISSSNVPGVPCGICCLIVVQQQCAWCAQHLCGTCCLSLQTPVIVKSVCDMRCGHQHLCVSSHLHYEPWLVLYRTTVNSSMCAGHPPQTLAVNH